MPDDFNIIFKQLKTALAKYHPPLVIKNETEKEYHLYSIKDIEFIGKKLQEMYFASTIIKKNFVGFYFFPLYTHPKNFTDIPAELKKTLKGKTCFNIKKMDPVLLKQIEQLLKNGFDLYKKEKFI
jgi:hypothetical protein